MITVNVSTKNGKITRLKVSGHALSAPHGEDLVCAGVSAISVGILNTLYQLAPQACQLDMNEGLTDIKVIDENDDKVQLILQTASIQYETVVDTYGKYIRIVRQEV